ncbi:MAG: hypothetical protein ACOZIN_11290 [Myxococcota bacterium]
MSAGGQKAKRDDRRLENDAKLELAIARRPDDAARWHTYAQWLTQRRDPRGKLWKLRNEDRADEAEQLVEQLKTTLFGDAADSVWAGQIDVRRWEGGFVASAAVDLGEVALARFRAFLEAPVTRLLGALTVRYSDTSNEPASKLDTALGQLAKVARWLTEAPCARSLRVLQIESVDVTGQQPEVFDMLDRLRIPKPKGLPQLRDVEIFFLDDGDAEESFEEV